MNYGRREFVALTLKRENGELAPYLTETFLSGPDARVNNLQEELTRSRVEDEDGAVDRFRRQITFECLERRTILNAPRKRKRSYLVDGDTVYIRVVDEPNDLIAEQLAIILRRQVGLGRLGRVQLQTLANTLAQYVERGIRL